MHFWRGPVGACRTSHQRWATATAATRQKERIFAVNALGTTRRPGMTPHGSDGRGAAANAPGTAPTQVGEAPGGLGAKVTVAAGVEHHRDDDSRSGAA